MPQIIEAIYYRHIVQLGSCFLFLCTEIRTSKHLARSLYILRKRLIRPSMGEVKPCTDIVSVQGYSTNGILRNFNPLPQSRMRGLHFVESVYLYSEHLFLTSKLSSDKITY